MKTRLGIARKRAQKGFTLIEMMIVVAIIAIIAGVIAINFVHAKSNAQVAAAQADMKQVGTALELYYSDNQAYPASGAVSSSLMGAKYLNNTPSSPGAGGGSFAYVLNASNADYTVADPAKYDAASLTSLGAGAAPTGGLEAAPVGKCGAAGCTHVGFSNSVGIFGYP